jgi:hypothetical protein
MNNIIFQSILESEHNLFPPKPAYQLIPNWWKKLSPSANIDNIGIVPTVKQCPPTIDILSSGYLIFTQCDMEFEPDGFFKYNYDHKVVERWYLEVTEGMVYPKNLSEYVYKFINRWIIKTEKGYSCLFIHPSGYPDLPFVTLPGVVDTDNLLTEINPPFRMKNGWTGIIPAGTPIAQIIPFKRENWKYSIENLGEDEFLKRQSNLRASGHGTYLKTMRESKVYR